ncbi:hypothetical protein AALB39_29170 [Lachnospiraceae bacterium 54-53]
MSEAKLFFVKVFFTDGDFMTTKINGTRDEVEAYYAPGESFNLGQTVDIFKTIERSEIREC